MSTPLSYGNNNDNSVRYDNRRNNRNIVRSNGNSYNNGYSNPMGPGLNIENRNEVVEANNEQNTLTISNSQNRVVDIFRKNLKSGKT
jgi:predicted ATPase